MTPSRRERRSSVWRRHRRERPWSSLPSSSYAPSVSHGLPCRVRGSLRRFNVNITFVENPGVDSVHVRPHSSRSSAACCLAASPCLSSSSPARCCPLANNHKIPSRGYSFAFTIKHRVYRDIPVKLFTDITRKAFRWLARRKIRRINT